MERLRGLLDDDLRATGHELPVDDRAETSEEDLAAALEQPVSSSPEEEGAAARRRRLLGAPGGSGISPSTAAPRALSPPLDPDEQPWVSPIRARLPWATLAIAALVLVLVVVSVLLRGGEPEAVVSAPSSQAALDEAPAADTARSEGPIAEGAEADAAAPEAAGAGDAGTGASGGAITVHVVGEVGEPGVVELPAGSRVADAVEAAGGLSESAVTDAVNMAAPAADGVQIVIPDQQLAEQWEQQPPASAAESAGPVGAGGAAEGPVGAEAGAAATAQAPEGSGAGEATAGGMIDLNTATAAELEELPKVGPVLAQRIIEHREQIGGFRSVEELDDVSGIGPAMMEAIAPLVAV